MTRFTYTATDPALAARRLDNQDAATFLRGELRADARRRPGPWTVELGGDLMFDRRGLAAVARCVEGYRGRASHLDVDLALPHAAWRDYYSLQCDAPPGGRIDLPIRAKRPGGDGSTDRVAVALRCIETPFRFPVSLAPANTNVTPAGLLMRRTCDHDLLFANQILAIATLLQAVPRSPRALLAACLSRRGGPFERRAALAYRRVHPTAEVHPTAVLEGATIGPGCRIGAHCVVRCSRLGKDVQLHDGAKVEYSIVDDHTWLMHDLVLYRCHVEPEVFLIHGPYQFSCFQRGSAAFATIMMDYRPDHAPIKVMTPAGVRPYAGNFVGALLEAGSKSMGGAMLAPGITVPRDTAVGPDVDQIIRPKTLERFASGRTTRFGLTGTTGA